MVLLRCGYLMYTFSVKSSSARERGNSKVASKGIDSDDKKKNGCSFSILKCNFAVLLL